MTDHLDVDIDEPSRRGPLLWTVVILGALAVAAVIASRVATDYLWFRSVNFQTVFTTRLGAQIGLMVGFGLVMFAVVFFNMFVAYRLRPKVRRANLDSEFLVQLRDALDRRSTLLMAVPALVLGVLGGVSAASLTDTFLAWLHRTEFGVKDPYFGLDAAYYVFTQPWLTFVVGYLLFAAVVGGIAALAIHFMTGALNAAAIRNRGNTPASLLRAHTAAAERVDLHAMATEGNVMRMREVPAIDLPAGQEVQLRHGQRYHLMLVNLRQPLVAGDRFDLTLGFEKAGEITVKVWVQQPRAGAAPAPHESHQH